MKFKEANMSILERPISNIGKLLLIYLRKQAEWRQKEN